MKMNAQYFIKKFEAIPDEMWSINKFNDGEGRCCAQGHCGTTKDVWETRRVNKETAALNGLMSFVVVDRKMLPSVWYPDVDVIKKIRISDGCEMPFYSSIVNNGNHPDYQQLTPKARILAALHDVKDLLIKRQVERAKQHVPTVEQVLEHDPSVKINYKGEWADV